MFKHLLYKIAGEDHTILKHCSETTQKSFLKTGVIIIFLFATCLSASYITFEQLFKNGIIVFALSLFFAWMITNIYRFLLHILTMSALPDITKINYSLSSLVVSCCFVCFISLIVSIPLESVMYSDGLNEDIKTHRTKIKHYNKQKIEAYYEQQLKEIRSLSKDALFVRTLTWRKKHQCQESVYAMYKLVNSSSYYLQRISFLCIGYPSSWLITLLFMNLFLYPLFILRKLKQSNYSILKGTMEKRIIDLNYYAFKKKYEALFLKKFNQRFIYTENYEDAPYNTLKKKDQRNFLTEDHLLTELYKWYQDINTYLNASKSEPI